MPGPPFPSRPTSQDSAVLMIQMVDEITRRLAQETARHAATEPLDQAEDSRGHALLRLRILAHVKQAVRQLEDQAAQAAAASGAGYPEIGRAMSMSRQGARRRWPGLITKNAHRPTHRPTSRSS